MTLWGKYMASLSHSLSLILSFLIHSHTWIIKCPPFFSAIFVSAPPPISSLSPSPMCSKILTFLSLSLFFHRKCSFSFYDFWLPKERRLFALCSEVMTKISHRKKALRKFYDFCLFQFAKKYLTISLKICVAHLVSYKIGVTFFKQRSFDCKINETLLQNFDV